MQEAGCAMRHSRTYRSIAAVYTLRFAAVVYVLHAFQKKSKRGIATPKHELDLIEQRLRSFFDKVEPTTLAVLFDFAHDLVRKVCNFSGSCAKRAKEDCEQWSSSEKPKSRWRRAVAMCSPT
jgi:hypothetical protein